MMIKIGRLGALFLLFSTVGLVLMSQPFLTGLYSFDARPSEGLKVSISANGKSMSSSSYVPHDIITIEDDTDLASVAVSGVGTEEDPFILEGWNITTSHSYAVRINGTTKYFILRYCWLNESSVTRSCGCRSQGYS